MWIAPVVSLATSLFLAVMQPTQLALAMPILGVWLAAPWIAWRISQPIECAAPDLTAQQLTFLRSTARKTWSFFETFVTAEENWLPRDNFQEIPTPTIASRTSPTNMGLALLANLAARDFGYLSLGGLIQRTQDTLATMQRLERYRGHFYNWYETRTLQPLRPLCISSVDSGNLAGHLLTLGAGLREEAGVKIFPPQIFAGLRDTVRVLSDLAGESAALAQLDCELAKAPSGLRLAFALLERATVQATRIAAALANENEEVTGWAQSLKRNCEEHLEDMIFLASWVALPTPVGGSQLGEMLAQLDQGPTLREAAKLEQSLGPLIEAALQNPRTEPAKFGQDEERKL